MEDGTIIGKYKKIYDNMTDEQKKRAERCKTSEEFMAIVEGEGVEMPDEMFDDVAGGVADLSEFHAMNQAKRDMAAAINEKHNQRRTVSSASDTLDITVNALSNNSTSSRRALIENDSESLSSSLKKANKYKVF